MYFSICIEDMKIINIFAFSERFRAGSRDETYENQGTSHVLRLAAGLSNKSSSGFGVRTNVKATGGALNVLSDRESIAYTVQLKRDELSTGLKYLQDVATQQLFKPWEVREITPRISDDLARVPRDARAIDLLHQAAYYRGLGNSVFCAKRNVGGISPECLQNFVSNNFTSDRTAVVGIGIDHQLLLAYAKSLTLETGNVSSAPSKYIGGQLRIDKSGGLATVAVGTQGASSANQKEVLAFAILRNVAGTGPVVKYGNSNGALEKVVESALKNPYEFSAFNASYSDNGLFGFLLTANAQEIGKVLQTNFYYYLPLF